MLYSSQLKSLLAKEDNSLGNVAKALACGLASQNGEVVTLSCRSVASVFELE